MKSADIYLQCKKRLQKLTRRSLDKALHLKGIWIPFTKLNATYACFYFASRLQTMTRFTYICTYSRNDDRVLNTPVSHQLRPLICLHLLPVYFIFISVSVTVIPRRSTTDTSFRTAYITPFLVIEYPSMWNFQYMDHHHHHRHRPYR